MIRRLFGRRKRRAPIARPTARLCLEQLEKREMLDAALVQGLTFLTLNAYQAAQQAQQSQATAQADLAHFQQNAASYSAGKGVTLTQINQDIATLKQDANNIQGANSAFQKDVQYILMGIAGNASNITSSDAQTLLVDAYFLQSGQSLINSALQTSASALSVTPPPPPATLTTPPTGGTTSSGTQLATLTLQPLDVNLLGLTVTTPNPIQINISAQPGNGELLGNLLGDVSSLVNVPAVTGVVNTLLGDVVTLLNAGSLSVAGVNTSGSLGTPPSGSSSTSSTSVLTLHVAPVTLNLMGAVVTTSPIDLDITAQSGQGLVLGNVVTDLANLFNPPLPNKLTLDDINAKLGQLLDQLNTQLPNVGGTTSTPPLGTGQFLALQVAPINLNLLGLVLQTSPIQVNATNTTGNGDLLGNIATTVLNTVNASPSSLQTFNDDLNAILGKVIGVLNASTLTIPTSAITAITSVSPVVQQLLSPTLVNTSGTPATAPILNLAIASPSGGTPVNVDLLGLDITTSNIQAQLLAQTGDGQILGNLLYNVANLLNPSGVAALLPILGELGL